MNTTSTSWPPPPPSPRPLAPTVERRVTPIAAIVLVTAVALAFADVSIVALAVPDLYIEFASTIPAVSWVLTGYALAVAVSGIAWLVLLRRVSGATLALAGAALFAASSLAAGFAPSLAALIAARVAQGVGGAALVAGSLGVLITLLGDSRRAARWWATAGVAGAALGPVLGGAVTQLLDWRAVFIVQAPVALMAAAATVAVHRRPTTTHVDAEHPAQHRRPRGALVADTALAFTFGALVGVLFLGVLLLVVVWGLPPIAGAVVVSALPISTLLGPRLAAVMSDRAAAAAGSAMLAGGLLTLAYLPSIQPAAVAAALALCGVGFGAIVNALNRHVLPPGSGARAATLTSTARHFGLVLGLAIIAPVLAAQVTTAAEAAPVSATKAMLDAPIDAPTKVRIALDIRDLLDDAADGEVPDLRGAFDRNGAGENAAVAQLHDDIELGVQEELTRSFRDSFTIAAGFAVIAGVVALGAIALSSGTRSSSTPSSAGGAPRRRSGIAIVGATLVVAVVLPSGAVLAGTDGFGVPVVADPCTAPPDPFPGEGFDAAAQRFVLSGLNGAACELGISREELVLSLEPRSGVDVAWDRDTIAQALKDGAGRAVLDAEERGTLPGLVAGPLRWTIERAPLSWFLDRLGVA
jgi:predicted MFS family arabinose efflux permease